MFTPDDATSPRRFSRESELLTERLEILRALIKNNVAIEKHVQENEDIVKTSFSYNINSNDFKVTIQHEINALCGKLARLNEEDEWEEKVEFFKQQGFMVVPRAIQRSHIAAALSVIHRHTEEHCQGHKGFYNFYSSAPEIMSLKDTPKVRRLVDGLLGPGADFPDAQIAIQFPLGDATNHVNLLPHYHEIPTGIHIDGMNAGGTHVPPRSILNFSLLVGVALTSVPSYYRGNFGAMPGSHVKLQNAIRDPAKFEALLTDRDGSSIQERLQRVLDFSTDGLGPNQPVCVNAGDAYCAHFSLLHFSMENWSDLPRVAIYFRVHSRKRVEEGSMGKFKRESMLNLWTDYEI